MLLELRTNIAACLHLVVKAKKCIYVWNFSLLEDIGVIRQCLALLDNAIL